MRTLKNNNFEVVFKDEKNFKLINKFGLKYAMAARQQLGF